MSTLGEQEQPDWLEKKKRSGRSPRRIWKRLFVGMAFFGVVVVAGALIWAQTLLGWLSSELQPRLEASITQTLGQSVRWKSLEIESVWGRPTFVLTELTVGKSPKASVFGAKQLRIGLSLLESVLEQSWKVRAIELVGAKVVLDEISAGKWWFRGVPLPTNSSSSELKLASRFFFRMADSEIEGRSLQKRTVFFQGKELNLRIEKGLKGVWSSQLAASEFRFRFPSFFKTEWSVDELNSRQSLEFLLEGGYIVNWSELQLSNPEMSLRSEGRYRYSLQSGGEIELKVRSEKSDLASIRRLIPVEVPSSLHTWLQASVHRGELDWLKFSLQGRLADMSEFRHFGTQAGPQLQLNLGVKGLDLEFHPDWPELQGASGKIELQNRKFSFKLVEPIASPLRVEMAEGKIDNLTGKNSTLDLKLKAMGDHQQWSSFVLSTPLKEMGEAFLDTFELIQGGQGEVSLKIPWNSNGALTGQGKISGFSTFHRKQSTSFKEIASALKFAPGDWKFNEISLFLSQGASNYDLPWSGQGQLKKTTLVSGVDRWKSLFDLKGEVSMEWVRALASALNDPTLSNEEDVDVEAESHQTDQPLKQRLKMLEGRSVFEISTEIELDDGEFKAAFFRYQSTLEGLTVKLPTPLEKQAEQKWPLEGSLRWGSSRSLTAKLIDLNREVRIRRVNEKGQSERWSIFLKAPEWGLVRWQDWWKSQEWAESKSQSEGSSLQLELEGEKISWGALVWNRVRVELELEPGDQIKASLKVRSRELTGKGTGDLPLKGSRWTIALESLQLPRDETVPEKRIPYPERPLPLPWPMRELPSVDLSIDSMRWGSFNVGRVTLQTNVSDDSTEILNFKAVHPDFDIAADSWKVSHPKDKALSEGETQFSGSFVPKNFRYETLTSKSLERIDLNGGKILFKLNWPGTPNQFRLDRVDGALSGAIRRGTLVGFDSFMTRAFNFLSLTQDDTKKGLLRFYKLGFLFRLQNQTWRTKDFRALFGSVFLGVRGLWDLKSDSLQHLARMVTRVRDIPWNPEPLSLEFLGKSEPEIPKNEPDAGPVLTYEIEGTFDKPETSLKIF